MSARARSVLFCFAVIALFALPLLPEILGTRRLVFRDAQITHWPWRRVAAEAWHQRRVPFINPSASGGEPLLANPNAVLLYPTVLLEALLPPASAFNLHYLLHVLWAFFGARALASRLRMAPGPSFVAGITYAFSGMMLSYGSAFMNSVAAAAWLPWCAAAVLELARAGDARQRLRAGAAAGIAFGMQLLAGEPAISILTALFAGVLAVGWLLGSSDRHAARLGRIGAFAAAAVAAALLAAGLAAPLLLPLAGIVRFTYRGQHLYSERAFGASPFAAWRMIEWLFPRFSGDPGALGPGGHWQYALHSGDLLYIWCVSFGVIPILLIAAAALSRGFWDRRARALAAGAVLSLLFAFGTVLPFSRLLFAIGALRRLRYPIKFYLLTTICVALLAGLAAEWWQRRRAGRREAILLGIGALFYAAAFFAARPGAALDVLVGPLLVGLKARAGALLPAIRAAFQGDCLFGLAAVAVVAAAIAPRRRAPGEGYWLGLATLLLALPWGLPLFVSADEIALERPPALLSSFKGEGRLYVSPSIPEFNVLLSGTAHPALPARVSQFARVQIEELVPATASTFGVSYLFDADPDGSYGFCDRIAQEALTASAPDRAERLLRAYGARWVLEDESHRLSGNRPVTGFVIAGRRLVLSRVPDSLAPLRWAGRAFRRASLSGALDLVGSEAFEPERDIALPGRVDRDDSPHAAPAILSPEWIDSDTASAQVQAGSAGYLIFSRTFFPAWKGTIDGRPAPVLIANGRDLAIAVPDGRHRVAFAYDRKPFLRGVELQAGALLLLLAACLRRRRVGRPQDARGSRTGSNAIAQGPDFSEKVEPSHPAASGSGESESRLLPDPER